MSGPRFDPKDLRPITGTGGLQRCNILKALGGHDAIVSVPERIV
jgi:hypothetical protein